MFCIASRIALSVALLAPGAVWGASSSSDEVLVITARSLEETLATELDAYGHDVEIITEQQIRNGEFTDLAQALQALTPGLYLAPGNGPFSYIDLSLQGSRTADVLWLVDGVRINNRLYNSTSPVDTLPAGIVERVEVLKGGQSLFYGTQAVAGAINIVTRGFTEETDGRIDAGLDSHGGYRMDGYVRGALGEHKLLFFASKQESEGYRPYSVIQPSATDRRRGYDVLTLGGKYQLGLAPDLRLNLNYQHNEARLDSLSPRLVRRSYNDRDEEIASARLDYTPGEAVQLFLKAYLHDWDTTYENVQNDVRTGAPVVVSPAGTYWGYQDYGLNAAVKLRLHKGLEYLLGYDFQNFEGRDQVLLIDKKTEQVHAGIVQIRTNDELSENAKFAAGLRYNRTEGSRTTVWNVSGRYDLIETLYVEGSGGTSLLLPDAEQLYSIDPCCVRGNSRLEPEKSLGVNLAIGGLIRSLGWQATYFARRITNLITDDYSNPALPDGVYINVDRDVGVRGAELQANVVLADAWTLGASYTYSRARNEGLSLQRDRIPNQFAKASLAYSPHDLPFGIDVALNWVGDAYSTVPGFGRRNYGNYAVIDLAGHFYLDGTAQRHRIGARVENVFDMEYATRGLGSAPVDGGTTRFLYANRGVPRTLHLSYGLAF